MPTNADVGALEAYWIDEVDEHVGPIGVKGIGEIGIIGSAAAVGKAVYHATGNACGNCRLLWISCSKRLCIGSELFDLLGLPSEPVRMHGRAVKVRSGLEQLVLAFAGRLGCLVKQGRNLLGSERFEITAN